MTQSKKNSLFKAVAKKYLVFALFLATAMCMTLPAFGAKIQIPATRVKAGQPLSVPVLIDAVDNLAGIKLVIRYDSAVLEFKKVKKTRSTSNLMHVVNSKNPGTIIVVMAGARGIKGKNFSILTLGFATLAGPKKERDAKLTIIEAELMSDKLKDIPSTIKANPIIVFP